MKKFNRVYQFKITLKDIKPPIWRRILVPENYSFWDLHVAIQDSMGWFDCHLHEFRIVNPKTAMREAIGIPDDDFDDFEMKAGWKCKIKDYFSEDNPKADYIYDFGDNWEHTVTLEKILPKSENQEYPVCVAGKRKCPPEDCGGVWGYMGLLEAINDPGHELHLEMLEWVGDEFDPEEFDPKAVAFGDPEMRFKIAFRNK
ncbi:MAG: plasmid pRiA4b ORF-3 family protein [Calditrichaeota bacterium]|nr:plasmid pRiA4b ORF-3 family protein [Calditrichota bacterium]